MKLKLSFFVCVFCSFLATAQETMTLKNSKSYAATPVWNFICENYALTGTTAIQIAKTEKGGIVKVAVETTNPTYIIAGTLYLFLSDSTIITCTDKNEHQVDGKQMITYYQLSPLEINRLKKTDIESIHFNIKGKATKFSSQIGNFTAVNKYTYFATNYDKTKKSYDTALAIKALFSN